MFSFCCCKKNSVGLRKGSSIALVGCSDGNKKEYFEYVNKTIEKINSIGLKPVVFESVFTDNDNNTVKPEIRARDINDAFADKTIDAIFDITGGDAAKEVLSFIDWELIKANPKPYFGYSDNSVIINPLHQKCGIDCYYYQLKFISDDEKQCKNFTDFINKKGRKSSKLFKYSYKMLQGKRLKGSEIVGGNIRCTLKLFDTPYKPDFSNRVLFLESYGGDLNRIQSFLETLKADGVFEKCSSVLLGNFSFISKQDQMNNLYKLVINIIDNKELPVACTMELGHQSDSKCLSYQQKF